VTAKPRPAWPWPDSLDALLAAPLHHTLLLDNDRVRVLDTRIAPGQTVPVHTHRWPSVLYVLGWSDFIRRDDTGQVLVDTRTVPSLSGRPTALWSGGRASNNLRRRSIDDYLTSAVFEMREPHGTGFRARQHPRRAGRQ
jgi:hypothetical protein